MRFCHACQEELDAASLAAARCANCGAVIRSIAQRTLDQGKVSPGSAASPGDDTQDSIDLDLLDPGSAGLTGDLSLDDTASDTPDESKKSGPQRKSPTIADRTDMTIEFEPPPGDRDSSTDSGATIDSIEHRSPRRTHPIESDLTIDLASLSPDERKKLESEWGSTFSPGSRQGQTIRQRETITGHRSSLPVKSRFIRERKKDGVPRAPVSPNDVPDYELLEVIGEGGMGVVYAAHQSSIARTVAVKMLKPSAKVGEEQRDKFISEAVVTGELDHPD